MNDQVYKCIHEVYEVVGVWLASQPRPKPGLALSRAALGWGRLASTPPPSIFVYLLVLCVYNQN